jgi:hypothetical protein
LKLDEDPIQVNKNTIELKGKKVLVRPSQAGSTKGKKVIIGEVRQPRMIKPKNLKIGRWKNERSKPRSRPKATFDIIMAKYRHGKADIRERKNQTIQFPKSDHPISLDQVSTFAARSPSSNQSRAPPQRNSEGRDHRQQEHHPAPYFPIRPPMPRPWGPTPMMYPPCLPWEGWYSP